MKTKLMNYQPLIIFWLGLLTGAMIVSLLLLNNMWKSQDGKAAVLTPMTNTTQLKRTTTQSATSSLNSSSWIKILDPTPWMPR